jgi:hypothetical protein
MMDFTKKNSVLVPKQRLFAPMLSTFGGGSARGFNPGGAGGEEYTYNPYAVTWSDTNSGSPTRSGFPLYYFSPEAISRGFSTTAAKYGQIWSTDNTYDRSVAFGPRFRVMATDSGTRFMDEPTITNTGQAQYPSWASYANNTNLPWPSPSFNNGSNWWWDASADNSTFYAGTINGGQTDRPQSNRVTATNATGWTNVNPAANTPQANFGEESSFRAGKYLFGFGYYNAIVWDLEDNPYPTTSNVHAQMGYTSSGPFGAAILCPQHNFLGLIDTQSATAQIWDYDDGTVASVNMGWGTRNLSSYGGGFYFLYPQDTSRETSFDTSTYSRNNYTVIESGYSNSNYSTYNSGSSFSATSRYWRGMSYNPFTEKHYLVGTDSTTNQAGYVAVFDQNNYNPSGTTIGRSLYVQNRGWGKPDPFSHKLASFGGLKVDYDS